MHTETIERVLTCQQLPTLPAVAARVIELTADEDVNIKELASTIKHDQALATRVLRTINSSYYALRERCTTIEHALVLLGLSAVKSLALGFSLVDTLRAKELDGFDYVAFWRRGLYTGVGARQVARAVRGPWEHEAFLCGLLQDIGVIAMYQALGREYADVVASTKGEHTRLARQELAAFDIQHPEIGAMLAQRWRLPDELVLPIRYHERPTAAPAPVSDMARALALGNMAHDVLTLEDPDEALDDFLEHAERWFGLDAARSQAVLRTIGAGASEIAAELELDAGPVRDVDAILADAEDRLVELTRPTDGRASGLLRGATNEDPLTGLLTRAAFDEALEAALDRHAGFALVLLSIDAFASLELTGGTEACDDAVLALRDAVRRVVTTSEPTAGRYGDHTVGVLLPGATRAEAERFAAQARGALAGAGHATAPRVSVGIVAILPGTERVFRGAGAVEAAALRAVDAARMAGGDCERTFVPRAA